MKFKEVMKTCERMCRTYTDTADCDACKLSSYDEICHDIPFLYPDEFEKTIEEWLKNNPVLTRKDTFIAKYPDRPWRKHVNSCAQVSCEHFIPCYNCSWWNEEVNQEEE